MGLVGAFASVALLAFSGTISAAGSIGPVEPIFARYAQTYHAPTLDLEVEYFRDKPMEEMDDFDGYTVTLDFTYPIDDVSQIELLLPLYTDGEGDYNKPGNAFDGRSLDVDGYGGVREFASIIYERRLSWLESKTDINIAWLAGAGTRLDTLDAKHNGELVDKFNHKGDNYQVGLKMDTDIRSGAMTLIGNLRYVVFRDTDDINLTGDDIDFEEDFEDYTSFSLSPGIIYTMSDGLDIKFGAPFRLTSDGQKYAGELELTYRF
jgi:hypothetical protein